MQENKINFSLTVKPNKRRSILKRNKNKKRSLLYCTLAICLIAGVWKINSLSSSHSKSLSPIEYTSSYQKPNDNFTKNSESELIKDEIQISKSAIEVVNEIEAKEQINSNDNLSNFRVSFNINSTEDVKKAQRILKKLGYSDIKEDGIFGPKTEAAWKLALLNQDQLKEPKSISAQKSTNKKNTEKPIGIKKNTDSFTSLSSTKNTASINNSILD